MRDTHVSALRLMEVMSNFRPINRDTGFLLPPPVDEWLPQRHLVRFVVDVVDGLDLSELVRTRRILADNGYFSQGNVEQCAAAKIEPLIAMGRSRHHVSWKQRFAVAPKAPPKSATTLEKMAHRLKTARGRKLYELRKQTPEPVFGIIKSVMGYRQCLLRGLENVKGEWNLVTLSWNVKRMFAMQSC
jgi:Transposase DDE domain